MRKICKTKDETQYCLTYLYIDDVVQIVEILKSHFPDVQIRVGDFVLDDVSELASLGKSYIKTCTINAGTMDVFSSIIYNSEITLNIYDFGIYLTAIDGEDVKLIGIKQKIGKIIENRIGIFRLIRNIHTASIVGMVITMSIALSAALFWNPKPLTSVHIAIKIIPWIMYIYTIILPFRKGGVYTVESTSKNSWWRRNKDSIIVGLIIAAFTSIITVIFTSIFGGK